MTEHEYSAEHIRVFELDEVVRRYPGMYFHVGAGDPRLPTEILLAAVSHIYHPPPRLGPPHLGRIEVVVLNSLVFSVTDDVANEPGGRGYGDTLIPGWRFYPAAAAAASTRYAHALRTGCRIRGCRKRNHPRTRRLGSPRP